jgi:cytosine/uracil/thiamine/allantoin permease
MISAVIGQFLVAGCVVMTGLVGARWHIGFPMWNRVVWGLRASYFPLANRVILSFTWCASTSPLYSFCHSISRLMISSSMVRWTSHENTLGINVPIYLQSVPILLDRIVIDDQG